MVEGWMGGGGWRVERGCNRVTHPGRWSDERAPVTVYSPFIYSDSSWFYLALLKYLVC